MDCTSSYIYERGKTIIYDHVYVFACQRACHAYIYSKQIRCLPVCISHDYYCYYRDNLTLSRRQNGTFFFLLISECSRQFIFRVLLLAVNKIYFFFLSSSFVIHLPVLRPELMAFAILCKNKKIKTKDGRAQFTRVLEQRQVLTGLLTTVFVVKWRWVACVPVLRQYVCANRLIHVTNIVFQ